MTRNHTPITRGPQLTLPDAAIRDVFPVRGSFEFELECALRQVFERAGAVDVDGYSVREDGYTCNVFLGEVAERRVSGLRFVSYVDLEVNHDGAECVVRWRRGRLPEGVTFAHVHAAIALAHSRFAGTAVEIPEVAEYISGAEGWPRHGGDF